MLMCSHELESDARFCATSPPPLRHPEQSHVSLLRIHLSKVFSESLSKKESSALTLVSMKTIVSVLRLFIVSNF